MERHSPGHSPETLEVNQRSEVMDGIVRDPDEIVAISRLLDEQMCLRKLRLRRCLGALTY